MNKQDQPKKLIGYTRKPIQEQIWDIPESVARAVLGNDH